MSVRSEKLVAMAKEDWEADSSVPQVLGVLLDTLRPDSVAFIDGKILAASCNVSMEVIKDALEYLSGERLGLFELVAAYLNEENLLVELPEEELRAAVSGEAVYGDGELIERNRVFVYFRGTAQLRDILAELHE